MSTIDKSLVTKRPSRHPAHARWWKSDRLIAWLAAALLFVLVAVPIGMLIFASFRGPIGALPIQSRAYFTFDHYSDALLRISSWRMAMETSIYTIGAVAVALGFALSLAWLTERIRIPAPNVVAALVVLPFLLPPSSITGSWLSLFWPRSGSVNVFLRENVLDGLSRGPFDPATLPAMILGQALFITPIAYLIVAAALRNMNGALEEMSAASGAGPLTTVRRITLPMLTPALLTAGVLGVWFTLDWTDVPFDLGAIGAVRLFSVRLYFQTVGSVGGFPNFGGAAAHAVLTLLLLFAVFAFYARLTRHSARYATVGIKGARLSRWPVGLWSIPLLVIAAFYALAMWVAPLYTLASGAINGGGTAFTAVLSSGKFWSAAANTMIVAVGSATLGTVLVLLVAWVVVRTDNRLLRRPLDLLATAPLVIPGLLAATAFLLVYLVLDWLPLWGTHLGITLALSYRLAIPYRLANVGMRQITRDMDDASATSGATPFVTLRRIVVPLLASSIAASWIIFFVFAIRERTIIQYIGFQVRTFTTMGRVSSAPGAEAAADLLMLAMVVAVVAGVAYALRRWQRMGG